MTDKKEIISSIYDSESVNINNLSELSQEDKEDLVLYGMISSVINNNKDGSFLLNKETSLSIMQNIKNEIAKEEVFVKSTITQEKVIVKEKVKNRKWYYLLMPVITLIGFLVTFMVLQTRPVLLSSSVVASNDIINTNDIISSEGFIANNDNSLFMVPITQNTQNISLSTNNDALSSNALTNDSSIRILQLLNNYELSKRFMISYY